MQEFSESNKEKTQSKCEYRKKFPKVMNSRQNLSVNIEKEFQKWRREDRIEVWLLQKKSKTDEDNRHCKCENCKKKSDTTNRGHNIIVYSGKKSWKWRTKDTI